MKRIMLLGMGIGVVLLLVVAIAYADITLTNASGESITFTEEELGTIAASGEKPFEGGCNHYGDGESGWSEGRYFWTTL